MKDKQRKQKGFEANAQKRPLLIIGGIIGGVVAIVVASYVVSNFSSEPNVSSTASISGGPNIESLPGIGDPSVEYTRLINEQNKALAEQALEEGGSALPTVVKPQFALKTDAFEREYEANKDSMDTDRCSLERLEQARIAGVKASELKCHGCRAEDLRLAGYTASELKAAGFSAEALKAAGFDATALKKAGFDACVLKAVGFSAAELLEAGFSVTKLVHCGYSADQLLAANVSLSDLRQAGLDVRSLVEAEVSPANLIQEGFCVNGIMQSLANKVVLRESGVDCGDLYDSGVGIRTLVALGYTTSEILEAGASVSAMLAEGVDAASLRQAGVSKKDISFAEKNLSQVKGGVCGVDYAQSQLNAGVQASVLLPLGCHPDVLREVGYPARDLVREGVSVGRLRAAGYSASNLIAAGIGLKELVQGCYSVSELLEAGYSAAELAAAGVPVAQLLSERSGQDLKAAGVSCSALYSGGVDIVDLKQMDCLISDLQKAGVSGEELLRAGYDVDSLRAAGFSSEDLLAAGVSVEDLLKAGYGIAELKSVGVTDGQLLRAGISSDRLFGQSNEGIGCSAARINAAFAEGDTVSDLVDKGCSMASLVQAGVSIDELLASGAGSDDLLKAGIGVDELLEAGVSLESLISSGVPVDQLLDAGVSVRQLVASGADSSSLLAAGVMVEELRDGGMSVDNILKGRPDPRALYLAGINLEDITGYSSEALAEAGYESTDMFLVADEETDIDRIARLQDEALSRQDRERRVLQLSSAMQAQASALFASWDNSPTQSINISDRKPADFMSQGGAEIGNDNQLLGPVVKAGTMMYAVLDSEINTEDPAPVTATIISGALKGAKILGEFQQEGEKLVLKFEKINIASHHRSTDISLFAVDVNTARNVTVDHHYLLKYGSLFAASFLEGLNEVAGTLGTTVSSDGNTTIVKEGSLSKSKVVAAGLGKVGENLVSETQTFQNKAPTIYMKAGATFGTLVMEDFTMLDLS